MAWSAIPVLASTDPFDKPAYDILKGDLEYLKGDAAWTAATYQNSWVDYGAFGGVTYFGVGFKLVGDFVVLRGGCKNGTVGSVIFTLPAGYRPAFGVIYPTYNNGSLGAISVKPDGTVNHSVGTNTAFFLDGIRIPIV